MFWLHQDLVEELENRFEGKGMAETRLGLKGIDQLINGCNAGYFPALACNSLVLFGEFFSKIGRNTR